MQREFYLTDFEQELVSNPEIMYAKNRVVQKIITLFAGLSESYVSIANPLLPPYLTVKAPKISRGEQYLSLPYVMLDYPRIFDKNDTFAIRTFFWWGQHFSMHLHMSGLYKKQYQHKLEDGIRQGKLGEWFWCVNQNEWQHHFEKDNYLLIKERVEVVVDQPTTFLKIAKKIPLNEWNTSAETLLESFRLLMSILTD